MLHAAVMTFNFYLISLLPSKVLLVYLSTAIPTFVTLADLSFIDMM